MHSKKLSLDGDLICGRHLPFDHDSKDQDQITVMLNQSGCYIRWILIRMLFKCHACEELNVIDISYFIHTILSSTSIPIELYICMCST